MKVQIPIYRNPDQTTIEKLVQRPRIDVTELKTVVQDVFEQVKLRGDEALREYTSRFDQVEIKRIAITSDEMTTAIAAVPEELKVAIQRAYKNIFSFHNTQKEHAVKVSTTLGVTCWRESRPIQKVGLYIPGGTAPLFSTVLMLGIPAQIAGCSEVILCSPPNKHGAIHPAILYTASLCGIKRIYKCGGSQAIAAMTMGTESIPQVYKIFGPGNQYVTAAKMIAQEKGVAIDMPAGPSEVLVYADNTAVPAHVAADLLSQAEHGDDSQVVLVAEKQTAIEPIMKEINKQLLALPRKDIAAAALKHAYTVQFDQVEHAFDFINTYAPEHFIIASDQATDYIDKIQNAGSVFLGHMTPESAGDYASGTNHTLPTAGFAKNYSGVSLDSFLKKITFQELSAEGLRELGPAIISMAEAEQLQAHANAIKVRMKN